MPTPRPPAISPLRLTWRVLIIRLWSAELLERLGSARMRAGQIELAIAAWTEAARRAAACW